jgi:hypothetical protein
MANRFIVSTIGSFLTATLQYFRAFVFPVHRGKDKPSVFRVVVGLAI